MEKLNTVSHRAQDEGGTTGRIYDSHDAQNKESPGVVEEGLRQYEEASAARRVASDSAARMSTIL